MPTRPTIAFPKNFLWGAATSAHQVEGGLNNQWTVWELENAKALATQAPYQFGDLPNWNEIRHEARMPENYVSGKTVDHYRLYQHDIALLKKLHLNTYRCSIEWSSIQPEEGVWNASEVEHYRGVLTELKKQGIVPVVTLFHFTLPVWFAKMGGFEKRSNNRHFLEYVDRLTDELGDLLGIIITINEPEVYAAMSYLEARWPPQQHNRWLALRVLNNLIRVHNQTAALLHKKSPHYEVSVAKNSVWVHPGDDAWLTIRSAGFMQYLQDDYVLKRVVKTCDFIGVNYYFSDRVYGYRKHNPNQRLSDLGWDMQPGDLEHALVRLHEKYKKPILITENGLADADDSDRKWWIMQTIVAMQRALEKDVHLIGYIYWSLLDNFEWDKGFWPKFGLVEVDRQSMKRTIRPSAAWFARVIKRLSA
ncbi:glycoside hydrolase family 1 protein [Candidatus Saccharibacteria bacterium]|nr:glycoside hydrolase family 1 protein [Candidatus Saccharibacteria bacterium]